MRKADFDNILAVLNKSKASRPTLFEFFLNDRLYKRLGGEESNPEILKMKAFHNAGYDYVTVIGGFNFPGGEKHRESSISLNESPLIVDRDSFNAYQWPDPDRADFSVFDIVNKNLLEGMKIIAFGPGGVLENVIKLCGYDNLCMMLADDPQLVAEIFEAVGSRLNRYYEIIGNSFEKVGAMISNDDWGFKTQTMLSPEDMRKYLFPWHKKIVETIHKSGRPAILHSCGNLEKVMDDIIYDMKYDAKHSYEDSICPVEKAYEMWSAKIAILGGIDVDFLCRSDVDKIKERARKMLALSSERGAYALGSGNSIPDYVPDEKYLAMISAAF